MVKFLAPQEPGSYYATFRLAAGKDKEFGEKIHMRLVVSSPALGQIDTGKKVMQEGPIDPAKLNALIEKAMAQMKL